MKKRRSNQLKLKNNGQAMLIAILVIFVIAIAIGLAVATIGISQNSISSNLKVSNEAKVLAIAAIDNTLMRMTRGDFTSPPNLSLGKGICTINISGSNPYQILAVAEVNSPLSLKKATKKIQVNVTIANGQTILNSWKEIY